MSSAAAKKIDFVLIANEKQIVSRCQEVCKEYSYSNEVCENVDVFADKSDLYAEATMIAISAVNQSNQAAIAGMVQVVRQFANDAYILVIADKKIPPDAAVFIKKSGASIVIQESEILYSSKLDFIMATKIGGAFFPMKISELVKDTTPDFTMYHLMPLNKKFVPVFVAGTTLSDQKIKKADSLNVGEIYVKRDDVVKYKKYIENFQDKSAAGLRSRCRAQYLAMVATYADLILLMTDESEHASFDVGKELYERMYNMSSDLTMSMGAIGEAWEIINNSAVGGFGSIERAPAIASYAGLMSLMSNIGDPTEVMVAALIADVGLLDLDPKITYAMKIGKPLNAEQKSEYEKHPIFSVNRILSRRIPLPEKVKEVVLATHEQADMQGFPNKLRVDKIPEESSIILFCEKIDQACVVKLGKARVHPKEARVKIYEKELADKKAFNLVFLSKLKEIVFS